MAEDTEVRSAKEDIRRVINLAEPELFSHEVSALADKFDESLRSYARQSALDKLGEANTEELAEKRLTDLKKSLALELAQVRNGMLKEPQKIRAERRLRMHIRDLLAQINSGLSKDQQRKVEDRMIRMLSDFASAEEEEREAVYQLAVEQILATIEPPARSQGASARSAAN